MRLLEGRIELTSRSGGANILIQQAAKSVKLGQVGLKLVVDVLDIDGLKARSAELGLIVGSRDVATGYTLANTTDSAKNSASISSRVFRDR
jgi:hypothetical protein